jgi:thiamine-phosphate pyrophosphorylase
MFAARTGDSPRAARIAGLYALTPDLADTAALVAKVAAALDGGAAAIQYRNKSAPDALRREQGRALAQLCAVRKRLFIVNDDAAIASEVGADGVHIGAEDGAIGHARECLGPAALVGVSCYDEWARARAAVDAGADYVAFGSFFASATKPAARHADPALLVRARSLLVPVVAIGGITSRNAASLIAAGAGAVAVIDAVFVHDDPAMITRAARAIADLFSQVRS